MSSHHAIMVETALHHSPVHPRVFRRRPITYQPQACQCDGRRHVEGRRWQQKWWVRHRLALNACALGRWDHSGLNRTLIEAVMSYTDKNGSASEQTMAGQLQYGGLGAPTRCLCVQRAQRVEEAEMDSVELISRTELKHKARNSGSSRNSVTD